MARITWSDLTAIYAVTEFEAGGTGLLTISTQPILDALLLVDQDSDAAADAGMAVLSESDQLELGNAVQVQFDSPRTSLGRFTPTFGKLVAGPKARVEEPEHYFVVEGRLTEHTDPASDVQAAYRSTLRLVSLLKQAATYLDAVQQELVFFRDGRIPIPVDYAVEDLVGLKRHEVDELLGLFDDPIHKDQKLTILSEAVIDIVAGLPIAQRFRQIMREAKDIADKVAAGYRLFASSFTYSKIRREVESAQADFLARMHKTFVDLQGQILGIPIATIVLASQLKAAKACGVEVWTNIAVVAGAWLFVVFLLASIVNQWMTLSAISFEFGRQRERLLNDFADVSTDFDAAFVQLQDRATWHRVVFLVVGGVAIIGAGFATWVAMKLIAVDVTTCF